MNKIINARLFISHVKPYTHNTFENYQQPINLNSPKTITSEI